MRARSGSHPKRSSSKCKVLCIHSGQLHLELPPLPQKHEAQGADTAGHPWHSMPRPCQASTPRPSLASAQVGRVLFKHVLVVSLMESSLDRSSNPILRYLHQALWACCPGGA